MDLKKTRVPPVMTNKVQMLRTAFETKSDPGPKPKGPKNEKVYSTLEDVANGHITYTEYLKINGYYSKPVNYKHSKCDGPFPLGIDDVATGKITFAEFRRMNEEAAGEELSEFESEKNKQLGQGEDVKNKTK